MPHSLTYEFNEGSTLLIDKPLGWTSFDVVKKIRNLCKAKTGHAGTLDPLATGLLIICTGKNTKKIQDYQGMEKEYTGSIFLGATRPSFDRETEIDKEFPIDHITENAILETAKGFIGKSEQEAPAFSALKVAGKPMYESARKGIKTETKIRPIVIDSFKIEKIEMPLVYFRILCSKGTYIRSVAHDFGKRLNSGAYLHSLVRTKIGTYSLEDAWNLEELSAHLKEFKNKQAT
ncbi:MAG: tRNA pseudouridine(55) synthase TruB [Chitinophagales bacterium]